MPSEPALSKPTYAKIASTHPTSRPPPLTPLNVNCSLSISVPLWTQIAMHNTRISATEIDSRVRLVRAESRMSKIATVSGTTKSTRNRTARTQRSARGEATAADTVEEVGTEDAEAKDGGDAGHHVAELQGPTGGMTAPGSEPPRHPHVERAGRIGAA